MLYEFSLFLVSIFAAAVASITGFGIGSLITPLLSLSLGTKLAVALVSIPHFIATALRMWMLRSHIDRKVLWGFGIMSAAGGLCGAFLHAYFTTPALTLSFGAILIFAGGTGVSGFSQRMRFSGAAAWVAGGISGFLGGLVGNQGGIRSAALMGFSISKQAFVATATAIGLIVDISRMPVYFWSHGAELLAHDKWIAISSVGVIVGTFLGGRLLQLVPEKIFRKLVSAIILALGVFMFYKGLHRVV